MTEAGFILGTAAYMSPEQARGRFVDQRTDIWAFGCVLYEMLTGKPAFLGEDVTSTLARVLETPAKLDALPADVPPAVRRTLELCLEKDARKRIADMRDVQLALAGTFAVAALSAAPQRRALPIAAAVAAVALAGAAAWLLKPAPAADPKIITRFNYTLPAGITLRNTPRPVLDIAPNGEFFAFNGSDGIRVRRMGEIDSHVIPGTARPLVDPVISPDGREVAYFEVPPPIKLVKVAIGGGAPVVLAEPLQTPFGLSWEPDGTLYYAQPDGIWRVSHNGDKPKHVIDTANGQAYGPQLLPGGEWLLFTLAKTGSVNRWNDADIVIQSLKSGERRVLRSGGFDARYLPSGYITYAFQNVLFASAFDPTTLKIDDERVALVQGVQSAGLAPLGGSGSSFYAVSNNGTLVFVPGTAGPDPVRPQRTLAWVDRDGKATPLPVRPDNYTMARLSPDGTRIALVVGSALPASDPPPDIYVYDLKTENLTQLTFSPESDDGPVWSRDGSRIFYRANKNGVGIVTAVSADGGTPEPLARSESGDYPLAWSVSPDGERLLLVNATTVQDVNLATVDIGKDNTVKPLLDLAENVAEPSLSPNGQWLLYYEYRDPSARDAEVDIRPFPDVRQQRRPVAPGMHPIFSADGSEIFFFDGGGLSVAPVQYSPLRVGGPRKLFRGQYWYGVAGPTGALGRAWDVDSKNDRFLMITMPSTGTTGTPAAQEEIDVVENWLEELKQRVPKH
jgi:Tol biopolymer transport system component